MQTVNSSDNYLWFTCEEGKDHRCRSRGLAMLLHSPQQGLAKDVDGLHTLVVGALDRSSEVIRSFCTSLDVFVLQYANGAWRFISLLC